MAHGSEPCHEIFGFCTGCLSLSFVPPLTTYSVLLTHSPRSTSAELGDMKVEHAPTDSTGYVQFKNVAKEREEEEKKKQQEEEQKKEVSVVGHLVVGGTRPGFLLPGCRRGSSSPVQVSSPWTDTCTLRTGPEGSVQEGQEAVGLERAGPKGRGQVKNLEPYTYSPYLVFLLSPAFVHIHPCCADRMLSPSLD